MLSGMSFHDWIKYNNENVTVKYGEGEYEIFIYERIVNDLPNYLASSDNILRASFDKESIGLPYSDIIKEKNYSFLFSLFSPNPNMINQMYDLGHQTGEMNEMSYYWLDPITHRAVKKRYVVSNYNKTDENGEVNGVIGISYIMTDIEMNYSNKYYDFVDFSFLIYISLTTFIISFVLYLSTNKEDIIKPLILLIGSNGYLTYYMSTVEGLTNLETEQNKMKDINEGILSISFLVAVNIFIIETLKKVKTKYSLHNESAFLFCVSLILLLLALYKRSNYNKIDDVRSDRIEKQFMYNWSIYINLFILINYLVYIGKETKILKDVFKI
jgi:hypothetical protein